MMTTLTATTEQYMPSHELSHQWYDFFVALVGLVEQSHVKQVSRVKPRKPGCVFAK
jgi:hypothetical protein